MKIYGAERLVVQDFHKVGCVHGRTVSSHACTAKAKLGDHAVARSRFRHTVHALFIRVRM